MSTEKDNLQNAEGQNEEKLEQSAENQSTENTDNSNETTSENKPTEETSQKNETETTSVSSEEETSEKKEAETTSVSSNEEDSEKKEAEKPSETEKSVEETSETETKAEDSETSKEEATASPVDSEKSKDFDETADQDLTEKEEEEEEEIQKVPEKNYDELSMEDMVKEAGSLLSQYTVVQCRKAFYDLRDAFKRKAKEEEDLVKEQFLAEGGNEIDFRHDNVYHRRFYDHFATFRAGIEKHQKDIEERLQESLNERENIIEELKALYTEPSVDNSQIFKKFRELKTRWHNAGRIPQANANNIFRTYYFHLDNFNEFLDLNQELRKMDYEHNLEVRHSIIERAKALLEENNVQKALNELQYLHRMWKEEAVPVAEEHREPTWQEFKDLTSKIHERKNELNEQISQRQQENLEKKQEIISKIKHILEGEEIKTHGQWQRKIKEMKKLRDDFFAIGRVPREINQKIWDEFKEVSRNFNQQKNLFYKEMKSEQMDNLDKKRALIAIALEHKESTNWNESVKVVKRIQNEWKKIGHVPRKFSDKIWNEFSDANNYFFDRYKSRGNEKLIKQQENLAKKEALLEEIKKADKPTETEALLAWLNDYSIKWAEIGFVPNGKQDINKDFSKLVEDILMESGLDKDAVEKAQWDSQIDRVKSNLDDKLLRNLKFDIRRQMDDVQKEVTHLQTNLAFFSNADDSNPLFKNAISNIENKVAELKALENKFEDLKLINLEALAEAQAKEEENQEEESQEENQEKSSEENSEE